LSLFHILEDQLVTGEVNVGVFDIRDGDSNKELVVALCPVDRRLGCPVVGNRVDF